MGRVARWLNHNARKVGAGSQDRGGCLLHTRENVSEQMLGLGCAGHSGAAANAIRKGSQNSIREAVILSTKSSLRYRRPCRPCESADRDPVNVSQRVSRCPWSLRAAS